jgi:alanyl-tRNA synthetase
MTRTELERLAVVEEKINAIEKTTNATIKKLDAMEVKVDAIIVTLAKRDGAIALVNKALPIIATLIASGAVTISLTAAR